MRRGTASHLHLLRSSKAGETVDFGGGHTVSDLSASGPYLDDLFLQVLALDPSERSGAVVALCEGDEDLEAELRALLQADEPEQAAAQPGTLKAGQPLDRYRLFKKLGRGASASVWQAWDTHLRTWTALKVLKPSLVATRHDALEVVLHEARAAAQIISENVVRVREAGRLDDGTCFVDMQLCAEYRPDNAGQEELVVGHPLSDEVGLLDAKEAARVMAQAARGVDAAHRVGVLHRDLKPANLLVQPVSRRVLVTDFGLALAQVAPAAGPNSRGTETVSIALDGPAGRVVGTPAWMAPEQARGEQPTRASDVYGLGATLYTMLSGQPPYRPNRIEGPGGAMNVVVQVRGGPPPPLKGPPRLVRIVNRAMARDPAHRYATAGALAADLERYVDDFPTSNDGPRPMLRMMLAARRNQEAAATLVILAVALTVFAGFVQQLELRRQMLMAEVEAAEQHRVEAVAAEASAVAAQRTAEAARLTAESARADAEAEAVHARKVQQSAERQKAAAEQARKAAEAGQSAAEQLAATEIRARQDAEQQKALAHAARLDTQQRLETLATQLAESEAGRARAEAQVQAGDAARRELEQRLSDEVSQRIAAETARGVAESERDVARSELAARVAAERAALEAVPTTPPSSDGGP